MNTKPVGKNGRSDQSTDTVSRRQSMMEWGWCWALSRRQLDWKEYHIKAVNPMAIPRDLLELADPGSDEVDVYLARGQALAAEMAGETVGAVVWMVMAPRTAEIVNLAVRPLYQNQGIGRRLIESAVAAMRREGLHRVEIGTGNSSIGALALYQQCGFRMVGVDRDYFIRHYPEPIFENGIQCRDQVRLALSLNQRDG